MDAIIGKYSVRMEETGLILTHPARFSIDLTLDEVVGLMEFINVYKDAIALAQRDTEPRIERVVVGEESSSDTDRTRE
jgi:hypothetical protein